MKTLISILLYIWQLPQNLVGLIVSLFYKADFKIPYGDKIVKVCKGFPGGISLGNTVIINKYPISDGWKTLKHEYGHTKQSLYLGPLYLIIVGLPSLLWAAIHKDSWKCSYYSFYTEKWADKLGNVTR